MYGAIFDMDGTLIDNNTYHFEAWKALFQKYHRPEVTPELYNEKLSGVPGMTVMREFFTDGFTTEQQQDLFQEKTQNYRNAYAPHLKPIAGLEAFLEQLQQSGFKMAIASSAAPSNIDFVLSKLPVRSYFDAIVDGPRVQEPKPHPQIFLKAAEYLGLSPQQCVVFEDSLSGIKAGKAAGMKVVGITTTHMAHELQPIDLMITDYTGLTAQKIKALLEEK